MRRALLLAALALGGCAEDQASGLAGVDPDGDTRVDMDPPREVGVECGPDHFEHEGRCEGPVPEEPSARCAWIRDFDESCVDFDGDCAFVGCEALPEALREAVMDCDEQRVDVGAGVEERCDGVDNDCDGRVDEAWPTIGEPCTAECGLSGKLECSVRAEGLACSVEAGQTGAEDSPELCDGLDEDCDGVVDEGCAVDLPGALRSPALCGDGRLILVRDARTLLLLSPLEGGYETSVLREASTRIHAPSCGPAGFAWLELRVEDEEPACEGDPLGCRGAHLWVKGAGEASDLTGLDTLGAPRVGASHVYWHKLLADPVAHRRPLEGGSVETLLEGRPASDPVPGGEHLALRQWDDGEARIVLRLVSDPSRGPSLDNPGHAGVATLNEAWAVWPLGDALWASAHGERGGFQVTMGAGPHVEPTLVGDLLIWLDLSATPALRSFDLATGAHALLSRGEIEPGDFSVGGGELMWIEGGQLHRLRVAQSEQSGEAP